MAYKIIPRFRELITLMSEEEGWRLTQPRNFRQPSMCSLYGHQCNLTFITLSVAVSSSRCHHARSFVKRSGHKKFNELVIFEAEFRAHPMPLFHWWCVCPPTRRCYRNLSVSFRAQCEHTLLFSAVFIPFYEDHTAVSTFAVMMPNLAETQPNSPSFSRGNLSRDHQPSVFGNSDLIAHVAGVRRERKYVVCESCKLHG